MNTNDLKEEIQSKLNPSMFRQIFSSMPTDDHIAMARQGGRLIDEIPEVEEDDDSYGDEDGDDDEDDEEEDFS